MRQCQICFENGMMTTMQHAVGHHGLSGCNIECCTVCANTHCSLAIANGAVQIRCPAGCGHELTTTDLRGIGGHQLVKSAEANRRRAREERFLDLFESAPALMQWASSGQVQVCPHCSLLIERSGGCSHMTCRCGGQRQA